MNIYKITNITNLAGKRDIKFNSILDIDYVDSMMKKNIKVKPGETIYLQISSLPLSVHRLRVKKQISVVEISNSELKNEIDTLNSKREMGKSKTKEETTKINNDLKRDKENKKKQFKSESQESE